jgi:hypothetical protein
MWELTLKLDLPLERPRGSVELPAGIAPIAPDVRGGATISGPVATTNVPRVGLVSLVTEFMRERPGSIIEIPEPRSRRLPAVIMARGIRLEVTVALPIAFMVTIRPTSIGIAVVTSVVVDITIAAIMLVAVGRAAGQYESRHDSQQERTKHGGLPNERGRQC